MVPLLLALLAAPELSRAEQRDAENQIYVAAVEQAVTADVTPTFTLILEGSFVPKGLHRALARRGLKPSRNGRVQIRLGPVMWEADDRATVTLQTGVGDGSSGTIYVVELRDGRWAVTGTRGGWVADGSSPPRSPAASDEDRSTVG